MKEVIFLCTLILTTSLLIGQDLEEISLGNQVAEFIDFYVDEEFDSIARKTHPNIISLGGGANYFIDGLKESSEMLKNLGMTISSSVVKQSSAILKTNEELQAMVPFELSYEQGKSKVIEYGFLFASSQDEGRTWFFVDMRKHDTQSILEFVPKYDSRLNVYLEASRH